MAANLPPEPGRPQFPSDYQVATGREGLLSWDWVDEQLQKARSYWLCTTRAGGRPHVAPVWGVWLEGKVCFGTDSRSLKGRNIARRPQAVIHLENGDEVVILEGAVESLEDPILRERFVPAYEAKYSFRPDPGQPGQGFYAFRPDVAFAWLEKDFTNSATRWRFS